MARRDGASGLHRGVALLRVVSAAQNVARGAHRQVAATAFLEHAGGGVDTGRCSRHRVAWLVGTARHTGRQIIDIFSGDDTHITAAEGGKTLAEIVGARPPRSVNGLEFVDDVIAVFIGDQAQIAPRRKRRHRGCAIDVALRERGARRKAHPDCFELAVALRILIAAPLPIEPVIHQLRHHCRQQHRRSRCGRRVVGRVGGHTIGIPIKPAARQGARAVDVAPGIHADRTAVDAEGGVGLGACSRPIMRIEFVLRQREH